ncbi:MAG: hypothetical protein ACLSAF_12090 [Intestinimonas sp.]
MRRSRMGRDDPASPQFVVTRRGLGYLFNALRRGVLSTGAPS